MKTCKKRKHEYPDYLVTCPECKKISGKKWRDNNKEKVKTIYKKYYEKNKNVKNKKRKEHYLKNKENTLKKCKEYRLKNKSRCNSYSRFYQQLKRKAVPSWANIEKINWFYQEANRLTQETGAIHHVDHIYPLQSKYMCGLHVETNLQILTKKENLSKGNRQWPGQLDCQKTENSQLSSSSSSSS
jgi:hypothetical protein